ncbi:SLBB domain-containing protein [Chloroflexota bacterium]
MQSFWCLLSPQAGRSISTGGAAGPGAIEITLPSSSQEITVQVGGAAMNPGLYVLTTGDRVADAIEAAGGLTTDAAAESFDPAAPLSDGHRITVYRLGDWPAPQKGVQLRC